MNKTQCLTLHILYGGLRYENEHFSSKYKSSWTDRFVFESPPQSICTPVMGNLKITADVKIDDIKYKTVQVDNYQATFLTLNIEGQLHRLDFIGKKEFNLKKGTIGQFEYLENHPLLLDYNETIVTTYINSKPNFIDKFVDDLKFSIEEVTKGWRNWTNYVIDKKNQFHF